MVKIEGDAPLDDDEGDGGVAAVSAGLQYLGCEELEQDLTTLPGPTVHFRASHEQALALFDYLVALREPVFELRFVYTPTSAGDIGEPHWEVRLRAYGE